MVWALLPADPLSGEDKYYIFKKGTYKVGRKGCDIIINKDKGVSRVHAEIIVEEMASLSTPQRSSSYASSIVRIKDCSKYGTFINKNLGSKEKVNEYPNRETTLKDKDIVSFGTGNASYRFCDVPLVFYICCSKSFQVNHLIQEKVSSIGAQITHAFGEDCTHVLLEQYMPLTEDLLEAVVSKKPFALYSWLEFVAEKGIRTEIPSCSAYAPTLIVEGVSVEIADLKARENCLKRYTFLLESAQLYSFGDKLQPLLEASGAKSVSIESFYSSSQVPEYNNHVVCVIPKGSADKFSRFNKLSLLSRVKEMELVCAALSGNLDQSILISATVLVSSSCSTDDTVVADSDEEVETATSVKSTAAAQSEIALNHVNKAEIPVEASNNMRKTEISEEDPNYLGKEETTEEAPSYLSKAEISMYHDTSRSKDHYVGSSRGASVLTIRRDKVDESDYGNSDVIYSQDLIIRVSNLPSTISSTTENSVPNFKRFRKANIQSGNSFNNLVPFSKYPYKDSELGSGEVAESVKEEKKRKQMEAIAEELFNYEKGKRRGFASSRRGLLSRG